MDLKCGMPRVFYNNFLRYGNKHYFVWNDHNALFTFTQYNQKSIKNSVYTKLK